MIKKRVIGSVIGTLALALAVMPLIIENHVSSLMDTYLRQLQAANPGALFSIDESSTHYRSSQYNLNVSIDPNYLSNLNNLSTVDINSLKNIAFKLPFHLHYGPFLNNGIGLVSWDLHVITQQIESLPLDAPFSLLSNGKVSLFGDLEFQTVVSPLLLTIDSIKVATAPFTLNGHTESNQLITEASTTKGQTAFSISLGTLPIVTIRDITLASQQTGNLIKWSAGQAQLELHEVITMAGTADQLRFEGKVNTLASNESHIAINYGVTGDKIKLPERPIIDSATFSLSLDQIDINLVRQLQLQALHTQAKPNDQAEQAQLIRIINQTIQSMGQLSSSLSVDAIGDRITIDSTLSLAENGKEFTIENLSDNPTVALTAIRADTRLLLGHRLAHFFIRNSLEENARKAGIELEPKEITKGIQQTIDLLTKQNIIIENGQGFESYATFEEGEFLINGELLK